MHSYVYAYAYVCFINLPFFDEYVYAMLLMMT